MSRDEKVEHRFFSDVLCRIHEVDFKTSVTRFLKKRDPESAAALGCQVRHMGKLYGGSGERTRRKGRISHSIPAKLLGTPATKSDWEAANAAGSEAGNGKSHPARLFKTKTAR